MSTHSSRAEFYQLWLMLRRVMHQMSNIRSKELSRYGLSMAEAGAMAVIYSLDGKATPAEVARQTLREPHTVSGLLTRMYRKGLVNKTPDQGQKNIVRVSLTDKGFEVYWKAMEVESVGEILSVLNEQERKQFWTALRKLRQKSTEYQTKSNEVSIRGRLSLGSSTGSR